MAFTGQGLPAAASADPTVVTPGMLTDSGQSLFRTTGELLTSSPGFDVAENEGLLNELAALPNDPAAIMSTTDNETRALIQRRLPRAAGVERYVATTIEQQTLVVDMSATQNAAKIESHVVEAGQVTLLSEVRITRLDGGLAQVRVRDALGRETVRSLSIAEAPCDDGCDLLGAAAGLGASTGCGVVVAVGAEAGVILGPLGVVGGAIISGIGCGLLGGILGLGTGRACTQVWCDQETSPDFIIIDDFTCDPTTSCAMSAFGSSSTGQYSAFVRIEWSDPSGSPSSYGARTGNVTVTGASSIKNFVLTGWKPVSPAPCATQAVVVIIYSGDSDDMTAPVGSSCLI